MITFFRIGLGIGVIILGLYVYPYYTDYVITPITSIATKLNPSMNILETTYLSALPLIILLLIFYFGIMHIIGKVGSDRKGEE